MSKHTQRVSTMNSVNSMRDSPNGRGLLEFMEFTGGKGAYPVLAFRGPDVRAEVLLQPRAPQEVTASARSGSADLAPLGWSGHSSAGPRQTLPPKVVT